MTLVDFKYTNTMSWNYRVYTGDNVVGSDGENRGREQPGEGEGAFHGRKLLGDQGALVSR